VHKVKTVPSAVLNTRPARQTGGSQVQTITNAKVLARCCRSTLCNSLSALINTSTHYRTSQQMTHKTPSLLHIHPPPTHKKTEKLFSNISSFCLVWLCNNKNGVLMGSHFSAVRASCYNRQTDARVSGTVFTFDRVTPDGDPLEFRLATTK
jgi:hypothetical protein